MNYDAHQEIDIDSLVTKTLQRFSSSKYNSKSRACSALHSRLISSGKLADRKLQALKGAIENQTWKAGDLLIALMSESLLWIGDLIPRNSNYFFSIRRQSDWGCTEWKYIVRFQKRCSTTPERTEDSETWDCRERMVWLSGNRKLQYIRRFIFSELLSSSICWFFIVVKYLTLMSCNFITYYVMIWYDMIWYDIIWHHAKEFHIFNNFWCILHELCDLSDTYHLIQYTPISLSRLSIAVIAWTFPFRASRNY